MLRKEGYDDVQTEVRVDTPKGAKAYRYVDVVGTKTKTGETKMDQVGDRNKDGSPVAREQRALDDIEEATGGKGTGGIRAEFEDKSIGEVLENIELGIGTSQTISGEGEEPGEVGGGEPEIPIDIP